MDLMTKNPGLQHLAQRMLIYSNKSSIASFRFINQDCKNVIDDPIFSLKKLSQLVERLEWEENYSKASWQWQC